MNERSSTRIAEAYGRHSEKYTSILEPILRPMAKEMVRLARLNAREWMLDLATGTGLIARTAVASDVSILGVDISLGVLGRARRLSAGEIPLVAGNAHKLSFVDHCFDVVTCGLSLSHFSNVTVALAEIRRILRLGGRFITSAWGSEGENPSKSAAVEVRRKFLADEEDGFQSTFDADTWADVERGCEALKLAQFEDVQVTTIPLSGKYRSPSHAVESAFAWPLTRYRIARLDPIDQQRLKEETTSAILEVNDLRWQTEIHYYTATST